MNKQEIIKKVLAKTKSMNYLDKINNPEKLKTLKPKERRDLNHDLNKKGFDGNGRFDSIGKGLNTLGEVLRNHGFEFDEVLDSYRFKGDKGRRTLDFARKTRDPASPIPIKNSVISFSWHLHESIDQYEILAYAS